MVIENLMYSLFSCELFIVSNNRLILKKYVLEICNQKCKFNCIPFTLDITQFDYQVLQAIFLRKLLSNHTLQQWTWKTGNPACITCVKHLTFFSV